MMSLRQFTLRLRSIQRRGCEIPLDISMVIPLALITAMALLAASGFTGAGTGI